MTTTELRRQRRTLPPGTRWVSYAAADQRPQPDSAPVSAPTVTAVRFAVTGPAPLMATHGVLLADEAHRQAGLLLEKDGIPDNRRQQIMGTGGAASDHRHAHWIPVPDVGPGETAGIVRDMVIWVPNGLRTDEVRAVLGLRVASGERGGEDGYEIRGFPKVRLLFQAAGRIEDVAPELCGPALRWRSLSPYLPVRHRKPGRQSVVQFLAADVATELRYRHLPEAVSAKLVEPRAGRANQFRRYRMTERMTHSRAAAGLVLEFAAPIAGPLLIGQLSHFGFGIFQPEP